MAEIDTAAIAVLAQLRLHARKFGQQQPADLEFICLTASAQLRALLNKAAEIVNHGQPESLEKAQQRADRLLARRVRVLKDRQELEQRRLQQD